MHDVPAPSRKGSARSGLFGVTRSSWQVDPFVSRWKRRGFSMLRINQSPRKEVIHMKRSWKLLMPLVIAASLVGCTGNGNTQTAPAPKTEAPQTTPQETTAKATVYPLTVKDSTGKEVTLQKEPQRIVSTSPGETEILFALGLNDRIVGVSDYDDYPAEAATKPKVGGVVKPSEEAILAQSPDLVIGGISMDEPVAAKLKTLGMPVYVTHPQKMDEIFDNILAMGVITNRQEQAEKVVASMKQDIARVQEAVKAVKPEDKKKVYLEFSPGWTVGKGEFLDELISLAGATNIAADTQGWNPISEEKILKSDPDVILYAKGITDDKTGKKLEDIIANRNGWDKMKAIRDKQIFGMEQNLLSRPGPRITQGLIEVAKAIYPDLVK